MGERILLFFKCVATGRFFHAPLDGPTPLHTGAVHIGLSRLWKKGHNIMGGHVGEDLEGKMGRGGYDHGSLYMCMIFSRIKKK